MTELDVQTEMSYEDEYIKFVRICQGDIDRSLSEKTYEDKALETTESGTIEHDFGKIYLPKGCKLDLEVVTPRPHVSVEVSTDEIKENRVEYGSWTFRDPSATTAFENWVDENNIKLRER